MEKLQQREMGISQRKKILLIFLKKSPKRFLGKALYHLQCYIMPVQQGGQRPRQVPPQKRDTHFQSTCCVPHSVLAHHVRGLCDKRGRPWITRSRQQTSATDSICRTRGRLEYLGLSLRLCPGCPGHRAGQGPSVLGPSVYRESRAHMLLWGPAHSPPLSAW